ncbi:MAG: L-serine ammonia-lyase, iron-sulfur-dependent, subunit alpha [Bacillota bacterium]|nr:L-serine ammonia-lyase, iron-sulfur-dependent, subunit alpha [Bacillota bacterium]
MTDKEILDKLMEYVAEDSMKALGCTEPVAIAYAGYEAGKALGDGEIKKLTVKTSKNIYKNAKSVKIPNSKGRHGIGLAGAIGVLSKDLDLSPSLIFQRLSDEILQASLDLVEAGKVEVDYVENVPNIYISVKIETENSTIESIVANGHTNLEKIIVDGQVKYDNSQKTEEVKDDFDFKSLSIERLKNIIDQTDAKEFMFTLEGIDVNRKAAAEGLKGYGSNLGKTLADLRDKKILEDNMITETRILTAAAADMRMGGGQCEVFTSGGSGNQGIGVILPTAVVAGYENIGQEDLAKALFFAHVLNRYVKEYSGKLSGICGCSIGASVGAAAGISYMLGGSVDQISGACSNIFANLTGMVCDGAKESCSMKLSTCAEESVVASYLALNGMITDANVGVVGNSIEETILNVGKLSKEAFNTVDDVMLEVINR